jgi:hypothetical protein
VIVDGAIAQLGERLNGIQEVDGSIPFGSTNTLKTPAHAGVFRFPRLAASRETVMRFSLDIL